MVADLYLPTRRAKRSDSRCQGFIQHFGSDSCTEVDAIAPDRLQRLIRVCIEENIDHDAWRRAKREEALARETLESLAIGDWIPGVRYTAPVDDKEDDE
jgi:hypothetical protein